MDASILPPSLSVGRAVRALTHPLLPDDYLGLIDPRWSARELTGTVVQARDETADSRTVVVRPTRPWPGHRAGQYVRIGVLRDGRRCWRAYSLTSDPGQPLISVTVKHVPSGSWVSKPVRLGQDSRRFACKSTGWRFG